LEKLAGAVLQSALTLGVNVATAEVSRGGTAVYLGLGGAGQSVGQQLAPGTNRPATVKVKEGAAIAVLVARDLDFAGMPGLR
jgi:type IV secretion system protein VirB10